MIPDRIGRYEVKSELGRGGMATVYLAHDPSFGRDVAVKVLPRQFMHDPTFRGRFEREARTIAALEHSAIVPVYDFGHEGEQPFLVMRHMSGGSLLDRMKGGPVPLPEVDDILRRVSSALDYAHSNGIIHRDLKPGNILFDQQGHAFLTDFGIAKLAESHATFTGSGIIGTPAYMSPEQIHGERDLDSRSDVYALGIILFEMLTGRGPYQADTPAKLMMKHVLEPVPPISQYKPDLPPGYDTVVSKALAKERDERYSTAGDLAHDLDKVATGEFTPPAIEATMLEEPPAKIEPTVVERPTPRPQPVPSPQGAQPQVPTIEPTRLDAPPVAAPAVVEEKGGVPRWIWGLGALALFFCLGIGGVAVLFGTGIIGGDGETPTQIAADTAVPDTPIVVAEDTPESAEPTATLEPEDTDTPEPIPTDTPEPEPTLLPLTFTRKQDDSGRISIQFPNQWDSQTADLALFTAPEVDEWVNGYLNEREGDVIAPGLAFIVVDEEITDDVLDAILETFTFPDNCAFDIGDQEAFDDGIFVGIYNPAECDEGQYLFLLAYDPSSPSYVVWVESYVIGPQEQEVWDHTLETFSVIPPLVEAEPTATATSPPIVATSPPPPTSPPVSTTKDQLLAQMRTTRSDMENMGGMIDNAVNTGFISCSDVVSTYDRVANAPSFNVGNSSVDVQNAHQAYRSSIGIFVNGTRDLATNCRNFLAGGSGGSIPFSQWGLARQSVNQALDVLVPALERLERA